MTANQITLIIFIIKLDYLCRKFLNENPFKYYTISSLSHLVSLGLFPLSPPPPAPISVALALLHNPNSCNVRQTYMCDMSEHRITNGNAFK